MLDVRKTANASEANRELVELDNCRERKPLLTCACLLHLNTKPNPNHMQLSAIRGVVECEMECEMECESSLCLDVLDELMRGIELIKCTYPLPTLDEREDAVEATEILLQVAVLIESLLPDGGNAIIREIQHVLSLMRAEFDEYVYVQVVRRVGHPALQIQQHQLTFLLENYFKITDIAGLFGCCTRTIQRRIRDFGIEQHRFSDISDEVLDEMVSETVHLQPSYGIRTIQSRLKARGFILQRDRVRDSIHRVDPTGIEMRLRRSLHRRQYSVPTPNSLWHVDGYHKLIRWRLIIHGGIDGYSRIPVYLRVASNNRADTVFDAFSFAVTKFGLPSRVRVVWRCRPFTFLLCGGGGKERVW